MLSRVIFDVQRDLVQNLHQRGGAALIKITSVLWVDNTFAVSAVVVDDRQKAVGCEKTHKSDITPFVLMEYFPNQFPFRIILSTCSKTGKIIVEDRACHSVNLKQQLKTIFWP